MTLRILHLLPRLLGMNGESGNVEILRLRSEWRGLPVEVVAVDDPDALPAIKGIDLVFIGSGPVSAQLVARPVVEALAAPLRELASSGVPFLAVGAGFQLLGESITLETGETVSGAGVFPVTTRHGGDRVVGDFVLSSPRLGTVVGFENRGSFVDVGSHDTLGAVVYGRGNTAAVEGVRGEEGFWEGNLLGTHMHGPILANNPELADLLLEQALAMRGQSYPDASSAAERLAEIDERARQARDTIAARPLSE